MQNHFQYLAYICFEKSTQKYHEAQISISFQNI